MTQLDTFSGTEQQTLATAPVAAATMVVLSHLGSENAELQALFTAWRDAPQHVTTTPLINELVARYDPETTASDAPPNPDAVAPSQESLEAEAIQLCREAVALLRAKATDTDLFAYQEFVLYIASTVARASTHGSVFGFGGVEVSLDEQSAIRAIYVALDYVPPHLRL